MRSDCLRTLTGPTEPMITRSGRVYHLKPSTEMADEEVAVTTGEGAAAGVSGLVKMIVEERRQRDKEMAEEWAIREAESRKQFELLAKLVESATVSRAPSSVEAAAGSSSEPHSEAEAELKLTKLSDADDVKAYSTTFERMMQAYKVPNESWVYKLAPQLTGREQQAYTEMPTADAEKYEEVKAAILRQYDINAETYQQHF